MTKQKIAVAVVATLFGAFAAQADDLPKMKASEFETKRAEEISRDSVVRGPAVLIRATSPSRYGSPQMSPVMMPADEAPTNGVYQAVPEPL